VLFDQDRFHSSDHLDEFAPLGDPIPYDLPGLMVESESQGNPQRKDPKLDWSLRKFCEMAIP
jgi:hypothetical protein